MLVHLPFPESCPWLADCQNLVCWDIAQRLCFTGRPLNFDQLCGPVLAEAEVNALVAGGQVASSRRYDCILIVTSRMHQADCCPDSIAIAPGSDGDECQPVISISSQILQNDWTSITAVDYCFQPAVVIQISKCGSPGRKCTLENFSTLTGNVTEFRMLVSHQQHRLGVLEGRLSEMDIVHDMT